MVFLGNVFEPRALDELFPDWRTDTDSPAPIHTKVQEDQFLVLGINLSCLEVSRYKSIAGVLAVCMYECNGGSYYLTAVYDNDILQQLQIAHLRIGYVNCVLPANTGKESSIGVPNFLLPPQLHNEGNYIISTLYDRNGGVDSLHG